MGKGSKKSDKKKVATATPPKPTSSSKSKSKSASPGNTFDEKTTANGSTSKAKKQAASDTASWAGFLTKMVAGDAPAPPKKKKKPSPPTPPISSEEESSSHDEASSLLDHSEGEQDSGEEDEEEQTSDEEVDDSEEDSDESSSDEPSDVETSKRTKKAIRMNGEKHSKKQAKKEAKQQAAKEVAKPPQEEPKSKKEKKPKSAPVANGNDAERADESNALLKKEILALLEEQTKASKNTKKLQSKLTAMEVALQKWQKDMIGILQKGFDAANVSANTQIRALQTTVTRLEASLSESFLNPVPSQQDVAVTNFASSSRYGAIGGRSSVDLSHPPGLTQ